MVDFACSKPLVSSGEMRRRMEGRRLMRMSQISAKRNTAMLDGDWVTIGVIASKSDQKVSANVRIKRISLLSDVQWKNQVTPCRMNIVVFICRATSTMFGSWQIWTTVMNSYISIFSKTSTKLYGRRLKEASLGCLTPLSWKTLKRFKNVQSPLPLY